jgi:hypothetical protein
MRFFLLFLGLSACLPEFPKHDFVDDPTHDNDGDGQTEQEGDCDDESALVYLGAPEICDGRDNDCDGRADEIEDADDGNYVEDPPIWYFDSDRDGFGSPNYPAIACTVPAGYADNDEDCDDAQSAVNPNAQEVCDGGIDNDCDGLADDLDDSMIGDATWYRDADADGYGCEPETDEACSTVTMCEQPPGYALSSGDCDDTTVLVGPLAPERCDGIDNDCDTFIDDADPEGVIGLGIWYADADGDGFGDPGSIIEACDLPSGYSVDATDCDDDDAQIHPDADELCATVMVDDNCNGQVDEATATDATTFNPDRDRDGYGEADADPADQEIACAAPTGFTTDDTDCDDYRDTVYPGATELCSTPTLDESCDGDTNDVDADGCSIFYYDGDADGYGDSTLSQCQCVASTTGYSTTLDGDCDDRVASINPGAYEDCASTADDDCDGDTNDDGAIGCTVFWYDNDNDGYGDSDQVVCFCEADDPYDATADGDCDESDSSVNPGEVEVCGDAVDNDCSGDADGADASDASTWYLDDDGDGYGLSSTPQIACDQPSGYEAVGGDCDDTRNGVNPGMAEDCLTSHDDDCSGSTNDVDADSCTTFYADVDGDGYGISSDTSCTCTADNSTVYTSQVIEDCDDSDAAISPGDEETCATSGVDDNCDGVADEEDADGCTTYFYDYDGDGYGINSSKCLCAPDGYYDTTSLGDCNDNDNTVNPGANNCGLNGAVSTNSASAKITGRSRVAGAYFGLNTLSTLDYNRDGVPDVVVGDAGEKLTYAGAGAVYLWLGPVSGAHAADSSGDADLVFSTSASLNQGVGYLVSAADVDGDGYDEVAIGTYGGGSGSESYLLDEGLTGLGTVTPSTSGVTTFPHQALMLLGDLNDDGFADGLLGSGTSSYFSSAYLAYGSSSGLQVSSTDMVPTSQYDITYYTPFNTKFASGDVDGDGADDLVGLSSGTLQLYTGGSAWDTTADASVSDSGFGSYYISSLNIIGDLNDDGYEDVAVGDIRKSYTDPYTGTYTSAVGIVYLFAGGLDSSGNAALLGASGTPATGTSDAVWTVQGQDNSGHLGASIAPAGDIDGDGSPDLALAGGYYYSVSSTSTLWYGPLSYNGASYLSTDADATFSIDGAAAAAGDTDADGYDDIWFGGETAYLFLGTPN